MGGVWAESRDRMRREQAISHAPLPSSLDVHVTMDLALGMLR